MIKTFLINSTCVLVLLLFSCGVLHAQTCYPIGISATSFYNCDDGTTAVAALGFSGTAPHTVNITKQGTSITQTIILSSNVTFYLTGLEANATYDIVATNNCAGVVNTVTTSITAEDYPDFVRSNIEEPCLEQSYEFCLPVMYGSSVDWTHNGQHMNKMGDCFTSSSYHAVFDGVYTVNLSYADGCITRSINFTLTGKDCNQVLPVQLAAFKATTENLTTHLSWSTTFESNAASFNIERSSDAKNWKSIGVKQALGESNTLVYYTFEDDSSPAGISYYRLKMTDRDGSFAHSRVVTTSLAGVTRILAYPNPVSGHLFVDQADASKVTEVSLVSLTGQVLYRAKSLPATGIDIRQFAPGIYLLKVSDSMGIESTQKILIEK